MRETEDLCITFRLGPRRDAVGAAWRANSSCHSSGRDWTAGNACMGPAAAARHDDADVVGRAT